MATVFVTGEFVSKYPEIVKMIEARGHQIAVNGWQIGEDVSSLRAEEQFKLIQRAFSAVRSAVDRPEEIVDFKPQGYKFNDDTIRILQNFGARSISGIFSAEESFCKCWYAKQLGEITFPYPITDKFWAIPISLDDEYINNPQDFLNYFIEKYNQQAETKEPLIVAVHPSITGADEAKLNAFSQFLDYVEINNGKIKPLTALTHHTQYISNFDVTPSTTTAAVGQEITMSGKYTANIYCPHYRFRVYGRYKDSGENWKTLDSYCAFVYTGEHSLSWRIKIPMFPKVIPSQEKYIYQIRVVGKASFGGCGESELWPTYDSWESGAMKEIEIEVKPKCILMSGSGDTHNYDVVFVPARFDDSELDTIFATAVTNNWNSITNTTPFNNHNNKFNFWRVNELNDDALNCRKEHCICIFGWCWCWGYWVCNYEEARALATRSCPDNDTTVVLVDTTDWTGLRWGNFCSTDGSDVIVKARDNRGNIIIHELGHSFGLSDEYSPYNTNFKATYVPCANCDTSSNCSKWSGTPGCIQGCNYRNDYRSSPDCMMNRNTIPFCPVCTAHLEDELKNLVGRFGSNSQQDIIGAVKNLIYLLRLTYDVDNEIITFRNIEVTDGFSQEDNPKGTFRYDVISFDGKTLYSARFIDPSLYVISLTAPESYVVDGIPFPPPEPAPIEPQLKDFVFLIPYFPNGKAVNIYNPASELLLSVDISQYVSGIIEGKVIDYNGDPVVNAFIQVIGATQDSTYTNNEGNYQLVGLEPGNYTMSVRPDPYSNLMMGFASVSVSAGEIITQDFSLNPAGSIAGRVTDINGNLIPNAGLYLSGYETPRYATNEEGKYIIPYLGAGTQTINIYAPEYGNWYIFVNGTYVQYGTSVTVNVTLGQTTWVDFTQQIPPSPDIRVLPEFFRFTLPSGQIKTDTLIISNMGNAPLEFGIEDYSLGMVIDDSAEGGIFDVKKIFVTFTPPNINFNVETYTSLEGIEGGGYFWLDTDQNPSTGVTEGWWPGSGLNDIGADYALYFYFSEWWSGATLYRLTDGYWWQWIGSYPLSLDGNHLMISIPLSAIEDDGIMDVTFMGEAWYPEWGRDIVPNVGHGSTKLDEVDWLSLSPEYGTVEPGNQINVTLTIDTTKLKLGEYKRFITITSNDIDERIVYIPVYLTVTSPPGDLDGDGDVDQNDLNKLLTYRNKPASACPACDLNGDGKITILDARKLVILCTRPRCATK